MNTTTTTAAAAALHTLGYCVLRLPDAPFEQFDVQVFLREQIEFLHPTAGPKVMGAFGALGNPCSFHHRDLRRFRTAVYEHMHGFFRSAFPGQFMQCVADRFSVRIAGTSVLAESWHRDSSVPRQAGMVCFGGWVNLDATQSQFLSCVPGTHKDAAAADAAGFARLTSAAEMDFAAAHRVRVEIPPRHCIVFNELLLHEVLSRKQTCDSYRLYLKYIIARDGTVAPFGTEIVDKLRALGVPPYHVATTITSLVGIKRKAVVGSSDNSEQWQDQKEVVGRVFEYPKMYSSNHVSGNLRAKFKIEDFSANIAAPFLTTVREGLVHAGKRWVHRVMPGLKETGWADPKITPDYTEAELDWFRPRAL